MDATRLLLLLAVATALIGFGAVLAYRHAARTIEAVVRQEQRYRSIIETQAELVCRYLPDATLTFVNSAYCRYFGRECQELIGRSFLSLLPESAQSSAREQIQTLVSSRQAMLSEHDVIRPDGTLGRQQWTDYAILGPDGDILELQAVGRDITDSHHARARFEQKQRELTRLSRTAQLGELSGALAHELSQPTAAILSNAQAGLLVLKSGTADRATAEEILEDIVEQAQRARTVIQSLRGLLKQTESQPHAIDLNELILDTTTLLRSVLSASQILVRHQLSPQLPEIQGDRAQLQQVMVNLIMNARDAMHATDMGQRELIIKSALAADGTIACAFSDAGDGIPHDCMQRILEPFFTTKTEGLGLGLSICHAIVTAHAGHLWASNNPVRGATVTFALPAAGATRPRTAKR